MTKEDFNDWKRHPITISIFAHLESLIQEGKDELALQAGSVPFLDARKGGKIAAFQDVLDMSFSETEQE